MARTKVVAEWECDGCQKKESANHQEVPWNWSRLALCRWDVRMTMPSAWSPIQDQMYFCSDCVPTRWSDREGQQAKLKTVVKRLVVRIFGKNAKSKEVASV